MSWKPSKEAAKEYANKMREIEDFCLKNGIDKSAKGDSYYFTLNGTDYRISNHTVEASNAAAYDDMGNQIRELYHANGREKQTVYIHAGKSRIIDIYNDLLAGFKLDAKGNRIAEEIIDYRGDADATKLVAAYEDANNIKDSYTSWWGDYSVHETNSNVTAEMFKERLDKALNVLDMNFEEWKKSDFNNKDFTHEVANIIQDQQIYKSLKSETKETVVINAYGGPGAGKTTACYQIACELKKQGWITEYVPEYAKELVWDNNLDMLAGTNETQKKLLEEQNRRLERLNGKVDFIVTDSPLPQNIIYHQSLTPEYESNAMQLFNTYNNYNFFVKRETEFENAGRIQDYDASIKLDTKIKNLLTKHNLKFEEFTHASLNKVVDNILLTTKGIQVKPQKSDITNTLPANYSLIAEYNKTVLAKINTEYGTNYTVWNRDNDGGVSTGRYFMTNNEEAFVYFVKASELLKENMLFDKTELLQIYKCLQDSYNGEYLLTETDKEEIKKIGNKIEEAVPDIMSQLKQDQKAQPQQSYSTTQINVYDTELEM